jgi:uncharacterized protein YndB with AHSA1/START domain
MAELVVTRRFDHSPERVFDAWLDPGLARRFLFTTAESEVVTCEIDARKGGRFRIVDRREGQADIVHVGEYREVDRPRRLVFTFAVPQFDPTETLVILDIHPDGDGCVLTLTHQDVPDEWVEQDREGWTMILEAQATALAS